MGDVSRESAHLFYTVYGITANQHKKKPSNKRFIGYVAIADNTIPHINSESHNELSPVYH